MVLKCLSETQIDGQENHQFFRETWWFFDGFEIHGTRGYQLGCNDTIDA